MGVILGDRMGIVIFRNLAPAGGGRYRPANMAGHHCVRRGL